MVVLIFVLAEIRSRGNGSDDKYQQQNKTHAGLIGSETDRCDRQVNDLEQQEVWGRSGRQAGRSEDTWLLAKRCSFPVTFICLVASG